MGLGRGIQQPARGRRLMAPADIHRERSSALGISELQKSRQTDTQRHTDKLQEFRELSWHTDRQPEADNTVRGCCEPPVLVPIPFQAGSTSLGTMHHYQPSHAEIHKEAKLNVVRVHLAPLQLGRKHPYITPAWGRAPSCNSPAGERSSGCGIAAQRS